MHCNSVCEDGAHDVQFNLHTHFFLLFFLKEDKKKGRGEGKKIWALTNPSFLVFRRVVINAWLCMGEVGEMST